MRKAWIGAVLAVPGMAVAQEEDIRGPKDLIEIARPEEITPWWVYGLWGLLAVGLIAVLVWWLSRSRRSVVSAGDEARKELAALGRDGDLLSAGDFAAAASGVMRGFIERRFGLAAPRRTTEEFLREMLDEKALLDRQDALRGFLRACDGAKFGRADLSAGERGELLARAREFIDGTTATKEEAA